MDTNKETTETPLVALIGPTNAGKSTLFNRLTGSWQAVTAKEISTTRDRVYGEVDWQGDSFTLVDTGGLVSEENELDQLIRVQLERAVEEADLILFVYDGIDGIPTKARHFLDALRGKKTVWLVANKVDSAQRERKIDRLDHHGFPYFEVSAATGRGCGDLLEEITTALPAGLLAVSPLPLVALVGRPNVGKSTLLNALTKTERAVVSPIAGTTRDVVTAKLALDGREYLLADTAGVRRRGQIDRGAEDFSVKRTLTAIRQASAVIILADATIGTARGDLHLLYFATELKKPVVIIFNKADLLVDGQPVPFHRHVARFEHITISAQTGQGIDQVAAWLKKVPEPMNG